MGTINLPTRVHYLADTSALTHMRHSQVRSFLAPLIAAGSVVTCSMVDLEVFFTARNHADLQILRADRRAAFPLVPMTQEHFERAAEVMTLLAGANKHRCAKVQDLLIAAVAETADLTLLHYDADFEHIAGVTGQPTEWVAPRGSL